MLHLRKSSDRGHFDHGWLNTYHTFSFADYYDPDHMGFRSLRVINEDRVVPGEGFGMHGHRDMEIVTWVLSERCSTRTVSGTAKCCGLGEMQHMSAGRGIRHSEFNPRQASRCICIRFGCCRARVALEPSYGQKAFAAEGRSGRWQLVCSPDCAESSLKIEQDARIYLANLSPGGDFEFDFSAGRHGWLQILRGDLQQTANR